MDATTKQRRWWQFGLRWLFVAMLVVAAYATGRSHQDDELRRANDQLRRALGTAEVSQKEAIEETLAMKEKYDAERATNGTLKWELRLLEQRLAPSRTSASSISARVARPRRS